MNILIIDAKKSENWSFDESTNRERNIPIKQEIAIQIAERNKDV